MQLCVPGWSPQWRSELCPVAPWRKLIIQWFRWHKHCRVGLADWQDKKVSNYFLFGIVCLNQEQIKSLINTFPVMTTVKNWFVSLKITSVCYSGSLYLFMLQHSFFSYNTISCHCFIKTCFTLFNRYPFKVTQCYLVLYLSEFVFVQPELLEKNSPTRWWTVSCSLSQASLTHLDLKFFLYLNKTVL